MSVRSFMMLLEGDAAIFLRSGLRPHLFPKGRIKTKARIFNMKNRSRAGYKYVFILLDAISLNQGL
jgi:hypothetical protein